MVKYIKGDKYEFITIVVGVTGKVSITSNTGNQFITTNPDNTTVNNLGNLPDCTDKCK